MELGFEQDSFIPATGDLVWAKVKGHPWWPARVFNPELASEKARETRRPGHILVAFFGDETYNWMKPQDLLPFADHFSEKEHQTSQKLFCTAVSDALEYLDERTAGGAQATSGDLLNYVRVSACSPLEWGPDVVHAAQMRYQWLRIRSSFAKASGVGHWAFLWPHPKEIPEASGPKKSPKSDGGQQKSQKRTRSRESKAKKQKDGIDASSKKKAKEAYRRTSDDFSSPKPKPHILALESPSLSARMREAALGTTTPYNTPAKDSVYDWTDEIETEGPVAYVVSSKRKRPADHRDNRLELGSSKKQKAGLKDRLEAAEAGLANGNGDYLLDDDRLSNEDASKRGVSLLNDSEDVPGVSEKAGGPGGGASGDVLIESDADVTTEKGRSHQGSGMVGGSDVKMKASSDKAEAEESDDDLPLSILLSSPRKKKATPKRKSKEVSKGSPPSRSAKRKASSRVLKIPDRLPKTSLGDLDEPRSKKLKADMEGPDIEGQIGSPCKAGGRSDASESTALPADAAEAVNDVSRNPTEVKDVSGNPTASKQTSGAGTRGVVQHMLPTSLVFGGRAEKRTKALHDPSLGQAIRESKEEGGEAAEWPSVEVLAEKDEGSAVPKDLLDLAVPESVVLGSSKGENDARERVTEEESSRAGGIPTSCDADEKV